MIESFQALLSPDELARATRFRFKDHRNSFALTRGALRTILGLYLDTPPHALKFIYGAQGKPAIDSTTELCFNTSHTGNQAIFAVTLGCELGLDLERLRPIDNMQDIANRFFCPAEAAELMSLPAEQREHAFFLCWTRNEAYIKAIGRGFSVALDSFRVSVDPQYPAALIHIDRSEEAARCWILHSLEVGRNHVATLAYRDKERMVNSFPMLNPDRLLQL